MAKIITGERPDIQKKQLDLELPAEVPQHEARTREYAKFHNIPAEATFVREEKKAPLNAWDTITYSWVWYEVTL